MILSGKKIHEKWNDGSIKIEPFDSKCLNPNSYNLHLSDNIALYHDNYLDMKEEQVLIHDKIPKEGRVLYPGVLYLGQTIEYTETLDTVPMFEGRSSIGRLGMFVHITAGFGDVGFKGFWTLEITVIKPIRIYAGVGIGQIYYHTIEGEYEPYSKSGKYQNNRGIQGSGLWKEFL